MIRPVTCVCFLLAGGAGLYVYQVKHRVSLIDHQIEQTVRATEATREQIRLLHAEWTRLSQPDRLQRLAGQFLDLQSTRPSQFTSMADLDARLPPVPPPQPPPQPAPAPPAAPSAAAAVAVASAMPAEPPPAAAARPPTRLDAEAPPARRDAPELTPSPQARAVPHGTQAGNPAVPAARPARLMPRVRPPIIETTARPAAPIRPLAIVARATLPPPALHSGSLLGMAQTSASGSAPPAPEPMPIAGTTRANGNE